MLGFLVDIERSNGPLIGQILDLLSSLSDLGLGVGVGGGDVKTAQFADKVGADDILMASLVDISDGTLFLMDNLLE